MNRFDFLGHIANDLEKKIIRKKDGTELSIVDLRIGVNRGGKNKSSDFFTVKLYGELANIVVKHATKGTQVLVTGHIKNNNYTNKDGVKIYENQFIGTSVTFCGGKRKETNEEHPTGTATFNYPITTEEEDLLAAADEVDF